MLKVILVNGFVLEILADSWLTDSWRAQGGSSLVLYRGDSYASDSRVAEFSPGQWVGVSRIEEEED